MQVNLREIEGKKGLDQGLWEQVLDTLGGIPGSDNPLSCRFDVFKRGEKGEKDGEAFAKGCILPVKEAELASGYPFDC